MATRKRVSTAGTADEKRIKAEPIAETAAGASTSGSTAVMWFRTDLRVRDNSALEAAGRTSLPIVGLFVVSPAEWKAHDLASVKIEFMLRNLAALKQSLSALNIPLIIKHAPAQAAVPELVIAACAEVGCSHLFFNIEYEVDESRRDKAVERLCPVSRIVPHPHHDQCIIPPGRLESQAGRPYTVYTPFKRCWYANVRAGDFLRLRDTPSKQEPLDIASGDVPTHILEFPASGIDPALWPAGEAVALDKLAAFAERRLKQYATDRNTPSVDGSSQLSPYLALGVLSARQCVDRAASGNGGKLDSGNEGAVVWVSEVIWRDFYRHVLFAFPRVCMNKPFKMETTKIPWRDNEEEFQRWCEGRTGYPLVDAGMRQLLQTGWMHNRLRMVVAMFLTKHLLIDWRKGERFFMQHLVDGDFASNNGGWQWSASTGTDAQPYFRIFNPTQQSLRFDASGVFVKRFVPELRSVVGDALHDPSSHVTRVQIERLGYVWRMVEHAPARQRALDAFKTALLAGKADEQAEGY